MLPVRERNYSARMAIVFTALCAAGCGDDRPRPPAPVAVIEDPGHASRPESLARVGGALWIHLVRPLDGVSSLARVDADGGVRVVAPSLPFGYAAPGASGLIVADQAGTVWRVDPETGAAERIAELGMLTVGAIAGDREVVVSHRTDAGPALVQIDPVTGATRRIPSPTPKVASLERLAHAGASVFAATTLLGTVVELHPDGTVRERATGQGRIGCLTATASHVVWFRQPEEEPDPPTWEIAGQPLAGGDTVVLGSAPAGTALRCASGAGAVYFSTRRTLARLVPGGAVEPGPATGHVLAMTVDGDDLLWIEEVPAGWAVRREPLSAGRR